MIREGHNHSAAAKAAKIRLQSSNNENIGGTLLCISFAQNKACEINVNENERNSSISLTRCRRARDDQGGEKRGYVTHDQVNADLPSQEVTSDQIEDVFAMLSEMGINVIENEEAAINLGRKERPID